MVTSIDKLDIPAKFLLQFVCELFVFEIGASTSNEENDLTKGCRRFQLGKSFLRF